MARCQMPALQRMVCLHSEVDIFFWRGLGISLYILVCIWSKHRSRDIDDFVASADDSRLADHKNCANICLQIGRLALGNKMNRLAACCG